MKQENIMMNKCIEPIRLPKYPKNIKPENKKQSALEALNRKIITHININNSK